MVVLLNMDYNVSCNFQQIVKVRVVHGFTFGSYMIFTVGRLRLNSILLITIIFDNSRLKDLKDIVTTQFLGFYNLKQKRISASRLGSVCLQFQSYKRVSSSEMCGKITVLKIALFRKSRLSAKTCLPADLKFF